LEPRFADPAERGLHGAELDQIVLESIKERSKWDLFPKAADARILFGLVQTPGELANCPQLESRDFYREVDHPVMGKVKVPSVLFNFSLTPYEFQMPAPTLGQHNDELYKDGLEYSGDDLVKLRQLGAI
jgi:crotonobetainyl-CoA:carnitine CoA-transferase CaiB-like acyl-CoA transferase